MHDVDDKFKSRVTFTILAITAIALGIGLVWIGRVIFLLLFASMIGAVLLTTVSDWLHRRLKIKHGLALVLFIVCLFGVIALLVWAQGPNIVEQFADLEVEVPQAAHSLLSQMQSHQWGQWLLRQSPGSEQVSSGFSFAITRIGGIVVSSVDHPDRAVDRFQLEHLFFVGAGDVLQRHPALGSRGASRKTGCLRGKRGADPALVGAGQAHLNDDGGRTDQHWLVDCRRAAVGNTGHHCGDCKG
jgi:hypothetical protein